MVYSNKFVVSILVNGRIVDEKVNGEVSIPFGSNYTVRLRNKHAVRAVGKIYIDNENVSGGGYIVEANSYVDIKRHANEDRSFKFVSTKSAAAKKSGKDLSNQNGELGVVEVRFYLEKPVVAIPYNPPLRRKPQKLYYPYPDPNYPNPYIKPYDKPWVTPHYPYEPRKSEIWCMSNDMKNSYRSTVSCNDTDNIYTTSNSMIRSSSIGGSSCQSRGLDGLTVKGNSTGQNFTFGHVNLESTYTTLRVVLRGYSTPTTRVAYCPNCGAKIGKRDRYCSVCGNQIKA